MPTAGSGRFPSQRVLKSLPHLSSLLVGSILNKLLFGIANVLEHFERQIEAILKGQEGVLCHMDDVLIFRRTQQEHDTKLHTALDKIQSTGVTEQTEV